jgi:hypothetical protein
MKVGDKVQYCGYGILGAIGEIICDKEKVLYYSSFEREGDDRYCMCYLVRYTMPNGQTVDNIARPEDLKLLENEDIQGLTCEIT